MLCFNSFWHVFDIFILKCFRTKIQTVFPENVYLYRFLFLKHSSDWEMNRAVQQPVFTTVRVSSSWCCRHSANYTSLLINNNLPFKCRINENMSLFKLLTALSIFVSLMMTCMMMSSLPLAVSDPGWRHISPPTAEHPQGGASAALWQHLPAASEWRVTWPAAVQRPARPEDAASRSTSAADAGGPQCLVQVWN